MLAKKNSEGMGALVYRGPGRRSFERRPKPSVQLSTDAVVKITKTTICGTDLHILKGDVPEVEEGRILGHEGVGVIESVGDAVSEFKPGDRVLISCITADGRCGYCRRGMYSHCENGGWVLGHLIDGTQAEYVRVPFADTSLYRISDDLDEEALTMLSDVFPTGYECGVLNGKISPGDTVAIIGAGPIGLSALLTSRFYSPSRVIVVDMDEDRLKLARELGAAVTINGARESAVEKILSLSEGRGVDVAIEAVGIPETFDDCQKIIAPGGRIANIGVHGKGVLLHLEKLWPQNITITTQLVDTKSTPLLLQSVREGKIEPHKLISHRFKLSQAMEAYDAFGNAGHQRVLKVILSND